MRSCGKAFRLSGRSVPVYKAETARLTCLTNRRDSNQEVVLLCDTETLLLVPGNVQRLRGVLPSVVRVRRAEAKSGVSRAPVSVSPVRHSGSPLFHTDHRTGKPGFGGSWVVYSSNQTMQEAPPTLQARGQSRRALVDVCLWDVSLRSRCRNDRGIFLRTDPPKPLLLRVFSKPSRPQGS